VEHCFLLFGVYDMKCKGREHLVTSADVSAGAIVLNFANETSGGGAVVQVRTAAGVTKAWDGAVSVSNSGAVTINNAGSVDWVDTDVVTVIAF